MVETAKCVDFSLITTQLPETEEKSNQASSNAPAKGQGSEELLEEKQSVELYSQLLIPIESKDAYGHLEFYLREVFKNLTFPTETDQEILFSFVSATSTIFLTHTLDRALTKGSTCGGKRLDCYRPKDVDNTTWRMVCDALKDKHIKDTAPLEYDVSYVDTGSISIINRIDTSLDYKQFFRVVGSWDVLTKSTFLKLGYLESFIRQVIDTLYGLGREEMWSMMKQIVQLPMDLYQDIPSGENKFKPNGVFGRFLNNRTKIKRFCNLKLWSDFSRVKSACAELTDDMLCVQMGKHIESLTKPDQLAGCEEKVKKLLEPIVPVLRKLAGELRPKFKEVFNQINWGHGLGFDCGTSACWEASRSMGGSRGYQLGDALGVSATEVKEWGIQMEKSLEVEMGLDLDSLMRGELVPVVAPPSAAKDASLSWAVGELVGSGSRHVRRRKREPEIPVEEDLDIQLNNRESFSMSSYRDVDGYSILTEKINRTLISMSWKSCCVIGGSVRTNVCISNYSKGDGLFEDYVNKKVKMIYEMGFPYGGLEKELKAQVCCIKEPLKIRIITKGESDPYYVSKPFQNALHSVLKKWDCFKLIGRTLNPFDIEDLVRNNLELIDEGNWLTSMEWVSGDYKSSTDNLSDTMSKAIIGRLIDFVYTDDHGTPIYGPDSQREQYILRRIFESTLFNHRITYVYPGNKESEPCVMDEWRKIVESAKGRDSYQQESVFEKGANKDYPSSFSIKQSNGQLMGSLLSFPILCLSNLCLYLNTFRKQKRTLPSPKTLKYKSPVLINGDDILYIGESRYKCRYSGEWCRGTTSLHHERLGAYFGLEMSPGKSFSSTHFAQINSTNFKFLLDDLVCRGPTRDKNLKERTVQQVSPFQIGLFFGKQKVMSRVTAINNQMESDLLDVRPISSFMDRVFLDAHFSQETVELLFNRFLVIHKEDLKKECKNRNLFLPKFLGGMGLQCRPKGVDYELTGEQYDVALYRLFKIRRDAKLNGKNYRIYFKDIMEPMRTAGIEEAGEIQIEMGKKPNTLATFELDEEGVPVIDHKSPSDGRSSSFWTLSDSFSRVDRKKLEDLGEMLGLRGSPEVKRDPSILEKMRKKFTQGRVIRLNDYYMGAMEAEGENPKGYQEVLGLETTNPDYDHSSIVPNWFEEAHIEPEFRGGRDNTICNVLKLEELDQEEDLEEEQDNNNNDDQLEVQDPTLLKEIDGVGLGGLQPSSLSF